MVLEKKILKPSKHSKARKYQPKKAKEKNENPQKGKTSKSTLSRLKAQVLTMRLKG